MTQIALPRITPGQLVTTVAEVTGVPRPTVSVIDRQLSEAGLRSKGGRGLSAAAMTPTDAANLLIAVSVARSDLSGVDAAAKYRGGVFQSYAHDMEGEFPRPPGNWSLDWGPRPVFDLKPYHSFGDLLDHLVALSMQGELINRLVAGAEFALANAKSPEGIGVDVNVGFDDWGVGVLVVAGWGEHTRYRTGRVEHPGDLKVSRSFSLKSIEAVGALLGGRKPTEVPQHLRRVDPAQQADV